MVNPTPENKLTDNANDWVIEITSPLLTDPIRQTITKQITIGRSDPQKKDADIDIDLQTYEAAKKGVSRRHVRIFVDGARLMISDLNTANGTVLNGQRLQANRAYALTGSDSLILGAFRMQIAITSQPEFEDTEAEEGTPSQTDELTEPKRQSVLIVEDHIEVAQLFAMILQKKGFETYISRDAARAMRYLQNKQPDGVILDMMLPGMNGTEVCRYIRRDASLDKTAIIIVSANRNPGTERAAYDAGADAFISKPVNAEELAKTVSTFIQKRKFGEDVTRELTDRDVTKALEEDQINSIDTGVNKDTVAILVSGYTDRPFTVTLNKPTTFGRGAYANPGNHADMSRFGAKDKGVSRMHMRLFRKGADLYIEDLDSMNGTYVDNKKLAANQPEKLKSGQQIRIGQLIMMIYFVSGDRDD